MHNREYIIELLEKYFQDEISPEELLELQSWASEHQANRIILSKMSRPDLLIEDLHGFNAVKPDASATLKYVLENQSGAMPPAKPQKHKPVVFKLQGWTYAAAVAIILFCLSLPLLFDHNNTLALQKVFVFSDSTQLSGRGLEEDHVLFTFSDGARVVIESQNTSVQVLGRDIYDEQGRNLFSAKDSEFATIYVPAGKQFDVTLADGSLVHMNAESTLKYPVSFSKQSRRVELKGEAFFTVNKTENSDPAKGLVPFIVDLGEHEVLVHGTRFNVRSYNKNGSAKVSLLEGKVSVHSHLSAARQDVFLIPGQQAEIHKENIEVKKVDIRRELSWKEGMFDFEGKGLYEVMDELARWYNIDLEYEGEVPDILFFGQANRSEKLISILQILKSADITFRLTTFQGDKRPKLVVINKQNQNVDTLM